MTALVVKGTDWINSCNTKRSRQQWPLCCFSFIIYYKPILQGEFIGDVHVHEKKNDIRKHDKNCKYTELKILSHDFCRQMANCMTVLMVNGKKDI